MLTTNQLQAELAPLLERVPPGAVQEFEGNGAAWWTRVDRLLAADLVLVGEGGDGVFGHSRRDHRFLASVLEFRLPGLLAGTLPWFYRATLGRGRPEDLPKRLLQHWMLAVVETLPPGAADPVNAVLRWAVYHHDDWVQLAQVEPVPDGPEDSRWKDFYHAFLPVLLRGSQVECLRLAEGRVRTAEDLVAFCLQVVAPGLREAGRLWETGRFTVAQEHRASAAARRTWGALGHLLVPCRRRKGRTTVTASADEWHDLGSLILADLLAWDGWEVDYLGANVPTRDLADLVRRNRPQVLVVSATVPSSLKDVRDLVAGLRAEHGLRAPRVIVGGLAFGWDPGLWRRVGADGHADNAQEALAVLDGWWQELAPQGG